METKYQYYCYHLCSYNLEIETPGGDGNLELTVLVIINLLNLEIETPGGDGNDKQLCHNDNIYYQFGNRNSGRRWKRLYNPDNVEANQFNLEIETPGGDGNLPLYLGTHTRIRYLEIETPGGDGNLFMCFTNHLCSIYNLEIETPGGDGNLIFYSFCYLLLIYLEIETPGGDGNYLLP